MVNQASAKPSTTKPPSRKPKRHYLPAEERRRSILLAAREVFGRAGLKGARTRELAQAAGINQATLFEHFESKEALFAAAVMQPLEDMLADARKRAEAYATADSEENLQQMVQAGTTQYLNSMQAFYPLLVQALFSDPEMGKKLYREKLMPMLQAQANLVKPYVRSGLDPRLVQLASFGMFFAISMDQFMSGKTQDTTELARQLTELITQGSAQ